MVKKRDKEELIAKLEKIKNYNTLVIVEGNKDKKSLEEFGIKKIITLNKKPLFKIIEEIAKNKEIIILTDLDKEGKKLYSEINSKLCEFGVKVNNEFREFLFKKTKLRQIEGLNNYLHRFFD